MGIVYPGLADILEIHREETGLDPNSSVRNEDDICAAVDRMKQQVFGADAYPTPPEKAAAFFQEIIQRHPFTDGNKRTAVVGAFTFIEVNGYRVIAKNAPAVQFARSVASGEHTIDSITEWFQENTEPADE